MIEDKETKDKPVKDSPDLANSRSTAQHWLDEIEKYDSDKHIKNFITRGTGIQNRYRDERNKNTEEGQRRFNSLFSWEQIVKPACYGQIPNAVVERRFLDHDPTGRTAAQILERALRNEMEIGNFHQSIERAVQDYLLPGRGIVWVRYVSDEEDSTSLPPSSGIDDTDEKLPKNDSDKEQELEETGSQVIDEKGMVDYVNWKDFRYFPKDARTWDEVTAVSKDSYLTKDQCIKRFGEDVGKAIQPEGLEKEHGVYRDNIFVVEDHKDQKRRITEIWDKSTLKVYWVSHGYQYLCDEIDDPLELPGFFPCPEPLDSILTTNSFVPIPFYHQWQDQANELDELNNRINILTKACKVAGIYAADAKALARVLNENTENALIPVENWEANGKLEDQIAFIPIKAIAETLEILNNQFETILKKADLITGVSDIMRGTSDARETMGAQRLKSNSAGTRIEDQRKRVGRFVRDTTRLLAEVIRKHFSSKTLAQVSGIFYEEGIANDQGMSVLEVLESGNLPQLPSPQPQLQLPSPSPMNGQAPQLPPPQMGAPASPVGAGQGMPMGMGSRPMGGPLQNGQMSPVPRQNMGSSPPTQQPQPSPIMMALQAVMKVKKAIELLKDDHATAYRIDVEVDTMVSGDQEQKRQNSIQFTQMLGGLLKEAMPIIMGFPQLAKPIAKTLSWNIRQFGCGRDIEAAWDDFNEQLEKLGSQPQQNKPNPEQIKMQTEQAKAQAEIMRAKLDAQAAQANDQREQQLNQQNMQLKAAEMQMQLRKLEREEQFAIAEHSRKMQELQITHNMHIQKQQMAAMQPPQPPLNQGMEGLGSAV